MQPSLRIVRNAPLVAVPTELLIVSDNGGVRRIAVAERAIPEPIISLLLRGFYQIDDAALLQGKMEATLAYLRQGRRYVLRGEPRPLETGLFLVVPLGFFHRAGGATEFG
jgi:hypothetical protein